MPITVNLRHLEDRTVRIGGELPVAELDLDLRDEIVQVEQPLRYSLEVERFEKSLLVHGSLELRLKCECVRCLKSFECPLKLEKWTCHVPLEGEDRAPVIGDCVDLTPYLREDILLDIPQHPVCEANCKGLPKTCSGKPRKAQGADQTRKTTSAWAELDKLKF